MDRYRRSERDRDDPDIQWMGAGESYRPGGGPPRVPDRERAAADTWSAARRDDRRDDRREDIDSYVPATSVRAQRPRSRSPGAFRRRSRSPAGRGGDTYSGRTRTPPRRFSPRRDERPRSPFRRRSRSPPGGRPRSPVDSKRGRDYSPGPRRSSPPPKRERFSSPARQRFEAGRSPRRAYSPPRDAQRGSYRPRSRTPPRRDNTFRRRSPSPRVSGPASNNTSRRSSPPIHPDRTSLAPSVGRGSPHYSSARNQADSRPNRSPLRTERSPAPRPHPERPRESSQPRSTYSRNGDIAAPAPPTGPGSSRNGTYDRPPPTGPSRGFNQPTQAPPAAGPSISAHNRSNSPQILVAPTRPRGAPPGRFDNVQRDFTAPAAPRGRGGGMPYRGGPTRSAHFHNADAPPPGPRSGGYGRGDSGGQDNYQRPSFGRGGGGPGGGDGPFPFRQHNNSSSSTYPRTQRFNTAASHLTTTEKLVSGGKLLPSGLPPEQEKKVKMLEAEAERIRAEIAEKQRTKREALTEWEARERASETEALKSELAEAHLQKLTEGDGLSGAAF